MEHISGGEHLESKGLGDWMRHDVSVTQENVWMDWSKNWVWREDTDHGTSDRGLSNAWGWPKWAVGDLGIVSLMRITLVDDHPVQGRLTELGGTVWKVSSEVASEILEWGSWSCCNPNHDDKVVWGNSHRLSGRGGFWSLSTLTTPPPLGIRLNRLSGFQSSDCPVFEWKQKGRTHSPPFLENPVRNVFVVSRPKWLLSKFYISVISKEEITTMKRKNIFMRIVKRIRFESKTQAHVASS